MPIPLTVLEDRRQARDDRGAMAPPTEDIREKVFELEARGEWIVQRVPEPWVPVTTKYGRTKKIPIEKSWHHKSCGQCGHIPGYSTSIFWLHRKLGLDYNDPQGPDLLHGLELLRLARPRTSAAQAAVAMRNFGAAYESGYFPQIHCGTSYGHYKEVREELVEHADLRDEVRRICDKLGKPFVMPEEIVHYSEWVYAHARRVRAAQGPRPVVDRRDRPPRLPLPQARRRGRDLRPGRLRRPANRGRFGGGHRPRRQRQGLLDLVRLLRLRLPPHPRPARLHPLVRDPAQDRGDARGGEPGRRPHPRHRLRHDPRPEPVRRAGSRPQGRRPGDVRGPVRRPGDGRPSVPGRPAPLAQHRVPAAPGEDGDRLARTLA